MSDRLVARTPVPRVALLSGMMFLQHGCIGAYFPTLALHFENLGFSGSSIGALFAMLGFAAMVTPAIFGPLADRCVNAETLMAQLHMAGAVLVFLLSTVTSLPAVAVLLIAVQLCYMPTLSLSNAVALRHLEQREREFGLVRLWGTTGWVVASWLSGLCLARGASLPQTLWLGAALSAMLAIFSLLALPATPPLGRGAGKLSLRDARVLLSDRTVLVFLLATFMVATLNPFVYPTASRFLRAQGASDSAAAMLLTVGQLTEIVALLGLARIMDRWGFRAIFLFGIGCWMVRFICWSASPPLWLLVASIGLHGLCYAFVFAVGHVWFDLRVPPAARGTGQALLLVLSSGAGTLVGNLLAGILTDALSVTSPTGVQTVLYETIYLFAAGLAALALFVAWFGLRPPTPLAAPTTQPSPSQA